MACGMPTGSSVRKACPPGKCYTARIFLNDRCAFNQPGDFTVICRCDFRDYLKPAAGLGQPIITTFKLTVLPAGPNGITQIIGRWQHVVETNGALGLPVRAAWVKPMILSDGENVRTFYQAIDLLRIFGGNEAAPGLASCVHFNDPSVRHDYNFRLILAVEFSLNGPKYHYEWHHDPNRDGTEPELADNRRILSELKGWLNKQERR